MMHYALHVLDASVYLTLLTRMYINKADKLNIKQHIYNIPKEK